MLNGQPWIQAVLFGVAAVAALYPRERWRKYLMNLCATTHQHYRRSFVHWLAARWNTTQAEGDRRLRVRKVRLRYFIEETPPPVRELLLYDWAYPAADAL